MRQYAKALEAAINDYSVMGKKMTYCRRTVLLTQRELGKFLNTNASCISKYETGKAVLRLPFLFEFANCFGVSAEDLANNLFPFESFTEKYTSTYLLLKADSRFVFTID